MDPSGADLSNFMRNPVVLANHDYSIESIIGKAVAVEVEKDGLYARTRFLDTDLAKAAFRLTAEGLGGWSIGFRPVKHSVINDDKGVFRGFKFEKWELLEYSSVAIPMNPDIVNNAIKRGLVNEGLIEKFFKVEPAMQRTVEPSSPDDADQGPKAEPNVEPERFEVHPAMRRLIAQIESGCRENQRARDVDDVARRLNK